MINIQKHKGLLFFCCSFCILVLTIINLSIGPITSGTMTRFFGDVGTLNCKYYKDIWDKNKDLKIKSDDELKYGEEYDYNACIRKKGMHDMEYTAFIFDIIIGFVCGLLGLLHLFEVKKDFVLKTGLIGLGCGAIGFIFTFIYVVFNGVVYTTVYTDIPKRESDYAIAEKEGNSFKCLFYDDENNKNYIYAKINDLGKKQYNYNKKGLEDYEKANSLIKCKDKDNVYSLCSRKEIITSSDIGTIYYDDCKKIYLAESIINEQGFENKDLSDRFLTTLILSLFVCFANIGLAFFGFLIFRAPGDYKVEIYF